MEVGAVAFELASSGSKERPRLLLRGIGRERSQGFLHRIHVTQHGTQAPSDERVHSCAFASISLAGQQQQGPSRQTYRTAVQVHNGLQRDQLIWEGDHFKLGDVKPPGDGMTPDVPASALPGPAHMARTYRGHLQT